MTNKFTVDIGFSYDSFSIGLLDNTDKSGDYVLYEIVGQEEVQEKLTETMQLLADKLGFDLKTHDEY